MTFKCKIGLHKWAHVDTRNACLAIAKKEKLEKKQCDVQHIAFNKYASYLTDSVCAVCGKRSLKNFERQLEVAREEAKPEVISRRYPCYRLMPSGEMVQVGGFISRAIP